MYTGTKSRLLSLVMAWQANRPAVQRRHARHDFLVFDRFVQTANSAGHAVRGERVLDIGCGYRFPITLLLHSSGAHVTGIDTEPVCRRFPLTQLRVHFAQQGFTAFARRLVRETVYKSVYFRALEKEFGRPLCFAGLDLRQGRIEELEGEHEFDVVFSNATFEHLTDVEKAVQVVARILKPKGLAYVSIHLFSSLSGGHDLALSIPGTTVLAFRPGAVPWRHLRDPQWQAPTSLNRLREHEYKAIFERYLKVREWRVEFWEPDSFLTEEILQGLPNFNREELLKRSVVVVAECFE